MPPLQALVALHGLWALAFLLVGVWAVRNASPLCLAVISYALSTVGLVALTILIGRELLTWNATVLPAQQKYLGPRILYVLGTTTDVPVVQVFLAGIALWFAARWRKRGVLLPETRSCGERPGPFV